MCEHCGIRLALGVLRRLSTDGFIESFVFLCETCRILEKDRADDPDNLVWQAR